MSGRSEGQPRGAAGGTTRAERLKARLRDNLRRRKDQARERAAIDGVGADPTGRSAAEKKDQG